MLDRRWLSYAPLVGVLILILGGTFVALQHEKTEGPTIGAQSAENAEGKQAATSITPAPLSAGESQKAAANEQRAGQDPEYYPRNDLVAQNRMADATDGLVGLTRWQIRVGAAETGLLLVTVFFTVLATLAASRASRAAEAAVQVTTDTAERQLRAYVHPMAIRIVMGENGSVAGKVRAENVGQTPAYTLANQFTLTVAPLPLQEEYLTLNRNRWQGPKVTVPPRGEVYFDATLPGLLTLEYREDIANERAAVFIHGALEYKDIFDKPHTTSYRYIYTGPWGGQKPLNAYRDGNDAT